MRVCLFFVFAALFLSSCVGDKSTKIHGNGIMETKIIQVDDFRNVESSGEYNLYFYQDSINDIRIGAESNIIPLIDVYVQNNKLIIENEDNYDFDLNEPISITIHHKGITDIDFSGAGEISCGELISLEDFSCSISGTGLLIGEIEANNIDISVSGDGTINTQLDCYDVEVSVSGTGNIGLSGIATDGVFSISGVGNIYAYDLPLKTCYTKISGTGDNYFSVSDYLSVSVSGIGNIYYKGNPEVDQNISGIGTVRKVD